MMASQVPVWKRSVPAVLSPLLPAMPVNDHALADLKAAYEYKVMHLEAADGNVRAIVLVRIAVPSSPNTLSTQRKQIRPMLFAHDLRSRSNVQWTQSVVANPVLRFQDDVGYMLHDRRYRCEGSPTCLASIRIRAWAHVKEIPPRDASKAPRTCAHCGRKGHRKQSCCESPGNCRLEIEWMHNHPVIPPSQASTNIPAAAVIDTCAPPPPSISITGNGDMMIPPHGAKRSMTMETFGNTRNCFVVKKSRPSSGASSVYPFAPSSVSVGPASCGGGHGCPCEGARVVRSQCAEKLRIAEAAIRDLTSTLSDLSSMHDDLSKRTQIQAGTICSIEQLSQQRDTLRTEVDELWAQRNALLGDIPNSTVNNHGHVNSNCVTPSQSPTQPPQPPPSLRRVSAQIPTHVPSQAIAIAQSLQQPPSLNGLPQIPVVPRMVTLRPQSEGYSERLPIVTSRSLEAAHAHPLVAGARVGNEVNNNNQRTAQKDGPPDLLIPNHTINNNGVSIKEKRNEESPITINLNVNDSDGQKSEPPLMDAKVDIVGKALQAEEKDTNTKVDDVTITMTANDVVPDVATFGFVSAEPIECGDNTETEEK